MPISPPVRDSASLAVGVSAIGIDAALLRARSGRRSSHGEVWLGRRSATAALVRLSRGAAPHRILDRECVSAAFATAVHAHGNGLERSVVVSVAPEASQN